MTNVNNQLNQAILEIQINQALSAFDIEIKDSSKKKLAGTDK